MNMAPGSVPDTGMSNQPVMPPYAVGGAYEAIIEAFRGAVEDAGLNVKLLRPPVLSCFTQPGVATTAQFKECFYLKNWPCRRLGGDKWLHGIVKAVETFDRPSLSRTKCNDLLNDVVVS